MKSNWIKTYTKWLKRKNFSFETIKKYSRILIQYGKEEINTNSITNFIRENLTKCEPATVRSKRNALSSYSKFLKKYAKIEWWNISKLIPTVQKKFFPTANYDDLEKLKNTNTKTDKITNERNNLIIEFLFYTGLRVSELINVRHCDYQGGLLKILGKGNKVRFVLLPEFLIKYFDPCSKSCLFLTRNGKKIDKGQIRKNIVRKTKQAGIEKVISPHTFRRSLATNLYNLGGKLETIQKQLGHNNIQTTLDYIHNDHQTLYTDYSKLWIPKK